MKGSIGGRSTNKLTDLNIKSFVQHGKPHATLSDGGGMFLTLTKSGTPVWRIKYRFNGKQRLFSVGPYPSVGLQAAREERDRVKGLLRAGNDPVQARRLSRAEAAVSSDNTFFSVAGDWLSMRKGEWSVIHYEKSRRALERDVFPTLGALPVDDITPAMVAGVVEVILKRGVIETAGKIRQHISGIFRYAQAKGLCRDNPADAVREILPKKKKAGRMAALLDFRSLGDVLRRAEKAHISPAVKLAHRLTAFSVARISNIVSAEWQEFDLNAENPVWTIPRHKLKAKDRHHDHKVFLGTAITEELRVWRSLIGGEFLFPSSSGGKTITRESVEKCYRETLGLRGIHSPHGWRSALSTLARDDGFERDVVEMTLDHVHDNETVRAYDRGERLTERVHLMNWWGGKLVRAERGGNVIPLRRRVM